MSSFATSLTAIVALLGTVQVNSVQANPVSLQKLYSFSIGQVEKAKHFRNGPSEKMKTLRKYHKPVPPNVVRAAAAGPKGSVTASSSDPYDSEYLCPVTTGSNTLNLDFDTGSADLWVYSNLQPSSQSSGHGIYTVDNNKKVAGATWAITYGDGSGASGTVYADKVVAGQVTATSQAVEAATSVSSQFQDDTDNDGLLGLAFSSLNTVQPNQAKTFFDNIKNNLNSPLFAVTLKYHAAGTYDFGYIDTSKYTGAITYVNINTANGFWEFTISGYAVGSSGSTINQNIDTIADTGTTLIYLPTAVIQAYYSKIQGAQNSDIYGGWVFPCSSTLQDFTVIIGGQKQTVPGKYLNYAPVTSGSSTCYGGIQDSSGIGFSILGDTFLKSKYVVHENKAGSTPRIGFAQQAGV